MSPADAEPPGQVQQFPKTAAPTKHCLGYPGFRSAPGLDSAVLSALRPTYRWRRDGPPGRPFQNRAAPGRRHPGRTRARHNGRKNIAEWEPPLNNVGNFWHTIRLRVTHDRVVSSG